MAAGGREPVTLRSLVRRLAGCVTPVDERSIHIDVLVVYEQLCGLRAIMDFLPGSSILFETLSIYSTGKMLIFWGVREG